MSWFAIQDDKIQAQFGTQAPVVLLGCGTDFLGHRQAEVAVLCDRRQPLHDGHNSGLKFYLPHEFQTPLVSPYSARVYERLVIDLHGVKAAAPAGHEDPRVAAMTAALNEAQAQLAGTRGHGHAGWRKQAHTL